MQTKIKNYISVACFAFFGGLLRCLLSNAYQNIGTMLGNIIGCFLLALITYFVISFNSVSQWLITGLGTGFVGAFTTFSSFNLDTMKLIQGGHSEMAILYFMTSIIVGLFFALIGKLLGKYAGRKLGKED